MSLETEPDVVAEEAPAEPVAIVEPEAPEAPEADGEEVVVEEVADEVEGATPKEPEVVETVEAEPIVFDANEPEFLAKTTEVLEKYELPAEVQAAFDALKTKIETPQESFAQYAEYAPPDASPEVVESAVKSILDRQILLDSVTETEPGQYRPDTDKFVQGLEATKASWLYYDLALLPSQKYQGLTQFEEGIADALSREGDTIGSVLTRYRQTIDAVKNGAGIANNVPEFVPATAQKAYWSVSKETRDEIDALDPANDEFDYDDNDRRINLSEPLRTRKLAELALIQKGIDGDEALDKQVVQAREARQKEFGAEVVQTQVSFYNAVRNSFAEELAKKVQFSPDAKMQAMLVAQNVALLTQAFSTDSDGDFARKALSDAGIAFDPVKAQQLTKDIEQVSVTLTTAKQAKDAEGNLLNPTALNKAKTQFEKAGKAWQEYRQNIINQLADLTSTGTTKAVEVAAEAKIEKKKLELKARPSANGVGTEATKPAHEPPPSVRYGSPEWDRWYARQTLQEREARKAAAYA